MRHTLMTLMLVGTAVPLLAAAQVPSTPATPPRAPKPSEAPAPRPLPSPKFEDFADELRFKADEMRFKTDEMRLKMDFGLADELRVKADEMRLNMDEFRFKSDDMRLLTELAKVDIGRLKTNVETMVHVDVAELAEHAREVSVHALADFGKSFEFGPGASRSSKLLESRPRAPWAQEDPADSLYRVAREALNRGEYRRAAQVFSEVTKKYPKSQYALDCAYWEAFSRYRAGATDDLNLALKILDERGAELGQLRKESNVDVQALRVRVLSALAARGDSKAADQLRREAPQSSGCDREEVSVRAEALSALGQMDLAAAMPTVRKVLARRDECTIELRRRALYLIGRQPNADAVPLILDAAKNDSDMGIRGEAMRLLPRVAGDNAIPQLEELLKTAPDEQTQRSAISALGSIDSDRARRAVRAIIERTDATERVRYDAIISLSRERDGRMVTAEEMAYLRSLYGKVESPKLKEAVLTSASRVASQENEQFLLGIARNTNETPSLRASALQRLGRMETVKVADIAKLYEVADSRAMREQILSALSQRKEPEAIDKMMDIAKKDTDPRIRTYAINLLTRSNNDRAKQLLKEMIEQ